MSVVVCGVVVGKNRSGRKDYGIGSEGISDGYGVTGECGLKRGSNGISGMVLVVRVLALLVLLLLVLVVVALVVTAALIVMMFIVVIIIIIV